MKIIKRSSQAARLVSSLGIAIGVILVSVSLAGMLVSLLESSLWWSLLLIALLPLLFLSFVTLFFNNCFDSKKESTQEVFGEMAIWTLAAIISLLVIGTAVALISIAAITLVSLLASMPIASNGL